MKLFALTGGIGSGKSSVASRLTERGCVIVDSDLIVRGLQQPGMPVVLAMVEALGPTIVDEQGALIRPAVAELVFNDPEKLKALNKIMAPAIRAETDRQTLEAAESGRPVVQDIPLRVETLKGRPPYSGIIVVDVDPEVAVHRLVTFRGFTEADARARIAKQSTRDQRLAIAGFVVDNGGTEADLDRRVEQCWAWMQRCPEVPVPGPTEAAPA
ncbi:MAG: dephospho-CoA kinase [Acidimicrobiales bacterium]